MSLPPSVSWTFPKRRLFKATYPIALLDLISFSHSRPSTRFNRIRYSYSWSHFPCFFNFFCWLLTLSIQGLFSFCSHNCYYRRSALLAVRFCSGLSLDWLPFQRWFYWWVCSEEIWISWCFLEFRISFLHLLALLLHQPGGSKPIYQHAWGTQYKTIFCRLWRLTLLEIFFILNLNLFIPLCALPFSKWLRGRRT